MAPSTIHSLSLSTIARISYHISSCDDSETADIRRDLVALALTSRSFSKSALDMLWHTLQSLAPLLRTLPEDLCTVAPLEFEESCGDDMRPTREVVTQLVVLRSPTQQDFERFLVYSRRIVRLGCDLFPRHPLSGQLMYHNAPAGEPRHVLESQHHIPPATWDFLSAFAPRPLLPNLQFFFHQRWVPYADLHGHRISIHFAHLLFTPRLKDVMVRCVPAHRAPEHATELVRSLSITAGTSLERLRVEASSEFHPYVPGTGSLHGIALLLFPRLTSFSSRSVQLAPEALLVLGCLPCLNSLLLHVNPTAYHWDILPHGRSAMLFPALLELTLHNIDFEWSTAFLNMLSLPFLQALSIRCQPGDPLPPPIALHALCMSIAGLPSAKAITEIYIIIGGMIGDDSARISDTYEIYWSEDIAPLFALSELRGLTVTGQCVVVADDFALATMSQNWSQLVILVLDWAWNMHVPLQHHRSPEDEDFPRATAWGLLQLARGCPRLFRLTLAVDLRLGPLHNLNADLERTLIPPVPLYGDAVSELVEFQSKGSLLSDTLTVASFLSLVFPGLQTIHNPSQEWLAIKREHKRLVRVRAQEREFGRRAGRQYRLPDVIV